MSFITRFFLNPMTTNGDMIYGTGSTPTRLAPGSGNQVIGMNSGATAPEYKTVAVGTTGSDFAVANSANTITLNLPDAGASARGAVTTGSQTLAGAKTFSGAVTANGGIVMGASYKGSFSYTITNAGTAASHLTYTVTYTIVDDVVTLRFPDQGVSTGSSGTAANFAVASGTMPAAIRPSVQMFFPVIMANNGVYATTPGAISISADGSMAFQKSIDLNSATVFTTNSSANTGHVGISISYKIV